MKANELRIGNYYLSFGVDLKQVEILHKDKILIDFTPIPLTEEWLLKFGFEFDEICNDEYFNNRGYKLKINCDEEIYICLCMNIWQIGSDVIMCYTRNREILYVHQLQNLYFALTGEELTFKSE